jgi:hypothetical protein
VTDKELMLHLLGPEHGLTTEHLRVHYADTFTSRSWLVATHKTHHGCPYPPQVAHEEVVP